jgi:hypothetical protein
MAETGVVGARSRLGVLPVALIVLLVLLLGFSPGFETPGGLMDEGMLLVYPELVQHGAVPYRDFETFYGPANPYFMAGVFSAFGTHIAVERAVGLLYRALILLAIFAIAKRWGATIAACCMLLGGCMLLGTGVPAYAWMGAVACALWGLLTMAGAQRPARCFGAGLLAGLSILFRPDIAPAIFLAALPFVFTAGMKRVALFACGGVVALLPLVGVTAVAGTEQVLNNLFIFPVLHANAGRHLPISTVEPYLVRLFALHALAAVVNVVAGLIAFRRREAEPGAAVFAAAALFAAGISHQAYQRLDEIHLLFSAFLTIALLPLSILLLVNFFRRQDVAATQRIAIGSSVGVAALVLLVAAPVGENVADGFLSAVQTSPGRVGFVEESGRSFPVPSQNRARIINKMLDKLDRMSKPGERLFVGPADMRRTNYCDTFIYHLMPKLRPATYFLEMNPFSANRPGSRLASDIATADWLVLNRAWDRWNEPNRSSQNGSEAPKDAVVKDFALVGEFGPYGLFHRKG